MKIFSTILIILIIIAVGFGAYWYFNRDGKGTGPLSTINIGDFFPFGQSPDSEIPTTPSDEPIVDNVDEMPGEQQNDGGNVVLPKLFKLADAEQAGAIVFASSTEMIVRYVDRQTGNIYEYNLTKPQKGRVRVTNTTVPKIYSATWLEKGNAVLLNYLDNRSNFAQTTYGIVAPGNASSSDGVTYKSLQTTFVGSSINPVANPGLQKIAYVDSLGDGSNLVIANKNGASAKIIARFATSEWNLSWPTESTIVATTKPSGSSAGYSYTINTTSGAMRKIMGDVNGLFVKPNGTLDMFLYSEKTNPFSISTLSKPENEKELISFKTLADKCSWSKTKIYCGVPRSIPNGNYPDAWYMGAVSFNDEFWIYEPSTGAFDILFDPKTMANEEVDATDIIIDSEEKYLLFTNKKDSSLWVYTL